MALRKSQFFLDNSAGALTDYSVDLNSVGVEMGAEVLDDTGLNETWISRFGGGIRDGQAPISGYVTALNTGILKSLIAGNGSSVSKTFQWKVGSRYLNGEVFISALKFGEADGKKLIPFSASLMVDGAINETGVAL